eukprot:12013953-Prorocentrum_lima.AAC.1
MAWDGEGIPWKSNIPFIGMMLDMDKFTATTIRGRQVAAMEVNKQWCQAMYGRDIGHRTRIKAFTAAT